MADETLLLGLLVLVAFAHGQTCDTTSKAWETIFVQERAAGGWDAARVNVNADVDAHVHGGMEMLRLQQLQYSVLETLRDTPETYRSADGYFYFRLKWPNLCDDLYYDCDDGFNYVSWRQTSNPMLDVTVTGASSL